MAASAVSLTLNGTWKHTEDDWQVPWQWPPSVFLYLNVCSIYMHAGHCIWHSGHSPWLWIERSRVCLLAAAVWHHILEEGTSPVCALSQPRSEWVPHWIVIACVFEYSVQHCDGSMSCMLRKEWIELVLEWTGPITRGIIVKATYLYSHWLWVVLLPSYKYR